MNILKPLATWRWLVMPVALITFGIGCSRPAAPAGHKLQEMSIEELEERFGHEFVQPKEDLDARFGDSVFVVSTGPKSPFDKRETGILTYKWKDFDITLRQGRPAAGWNVRDEWVGRKDIKFIAVPDGEIALHPSGTKPKTFGAAIRTYPEWLIEMTVGPISRATKVEDFEEFVLGLEGGGT